MRLTPADVPLRGDSAERFLPWLLAFMVYLAGLTLAGAMAISNTVQQWDKDLAGEITIQLPPSDGTNESYAADTLAEVQTLLQSEPGVRSVTVVDDTEMAQLLEPWLGSGVVGQGLPLPRMLAVAVESPSSPDVAELRTRLADIDPAIVVDDHQRWLGGLLGLARTVQGIAMGITLAIAVLSVVAVIFVTRTGLAVHSQVIELLHLIGAQDAYIARQFQWHALILGLRGGALGLLLAVVTLVPIGLLLRDTGIGLLPGVSLGLWEWVLLLALPIVSALIAMGTARATVLTTLSGKL